MVKEGNVLKRKAHKDSKEDKLVFQEKDVDVR